MKLAFTCDGMLGKLSRWLRILGYSVDFLANREDRELLSHCQQFSTILLTGDVELFKRASSMNVAAHLVSVHESVSYQLAKLSRKYNLKLTPVADYGRCSVCNGELNPIPRSAALGLVPTTSLSIYNKFWRCANCDKIYWKGGHWVKILKVFEEAKKIANS